jgi:chromosome segregation protein
MEMADILYGVTMQELGISKIISVKMNRESDKQIDEILNQKNG